MKHYNIQNYIRYKNDVEDTIKRIDRYIDMGFPVCIWPETLKEKDINDIFLSGMNTVKILDLINRNTHRGMRAKFVLRKWKKC